MTTSETAFQEFRGHLSRFIAKRLSNRNDVEDILQDVFLRVVRNEQSLQNTKVPLAWLYTVTRSALIDHYRKQSRILLQDMEGMAAEDVHTTSQQAETDFDRCLSPLIDSLPAKYREAVKFVDIDGRRQTELAEKTGLSVSAAKSRAQRGRKMLKDAILNCCHVELDNFNNVVALEPNDTDREKCC